MAKPTKPKDLKPKADEEAAPKAATAGGGGGSALDIKFVILLVVMVVSSILGSAGSVYLMTSMVVTPEIQKIAKGSAGGEHGADADAEHGTEGAAEASHEVGMNLELDEFMINLKSDPALGGNQYLKAKMALSIKPPDKENCYLHHEGAFRRPQASTAIAMGSGRTPFKTPQSANQITPFSSAYRNLFKNGQFGGAAAPIPSMLPNDAVDPLKRAFLNGTAPDRTLLANEGGGPPPCETDFKHSMGRYVPTIRDVINAALMKRTASQLASAEGQETLKDEIKEQLSQMMAPDYEVLRVNFQDFIIQK